MAVHKIDGGPGGQNDHFPKKFVTLYGTAAITAGNWAMLDITDTTNGLGASVVTGVADDAAGDNGNLTFGIATETTTAAGEVVIQIAGMYDGANVGASVAAGESLVMDNTSAGRVLTYAAGTHTKATPCGIALEDDTANAAAVMIINQGYF